MKAPLFVLVLSGIGAAFLSSRGSAGPLLGGALASAASVDNGENAAAMYLRGELAEVDSDRRLWTVGNATICTTIDDCLNYRNCKTVRGGVKRLCTCMNGKCRKKAKDCKAQTPFGCLAGMECVVKSNKPAMAWGKCKRLDAPPPPGPGLPGAPQGGASLPGTPQGGASGGAVEITQASPPDAPQGGASLPDAPQAGETAMMDTAPPTFFPTSTSTQSPTDDDDIGCIDQHGNAC